MRYTYYFFVWPDEEAIPARFSREVFQLFELLRTRIGCEFTVGEFEKFREKLKENGFTLREIERVPYVPPEAVL